MSVLRDGDKIILANEFYKREIDISAGPVSTSWGIRPHGNKQGKVWYPVFSFEPSVPFEAAAVIDGTIYEAGAHRHEREWDRRGSFSVRKASVGRGKFGECLDLYCSAREGFSVPVELHIRYDVCDDMPLVIKTVDVTNVSDHDVVVNNLTTEMVRFFDRRLPIAIFSDYYWDVKTDDPYYMCWTRIEFPDPVNMKLSPGEVFKSFTCFEAVTSIDRDEEAITLHRIYKRVAPWIKNPFIGCYTNLCNSYRELMEFVDTASQNGIEEICFFAGQLFTNTGDYVLRPDLFPNGDADVIELNRYCHGKGIKSLPYCSTTIASNDSLVKAEHPDWQYLGPDAMRYDPGSLGNMCYQSSWGDYIREKLLYLLDTLEFDGLSLDGPYHGLPCLEVNHKHRSAEAVRYMNWMWEKAFFHDVIKRGKYMTAPQSWQSMLLGVKLRPAGYREEDQNEFGGMPTGGYDQGLPV